MEEIIRVENIVYSEKNNKIINYLSFDVCKNEIVGIYTSNMYEKNVLIDLLLGIKKPSSGRIYFNDKQVNLFNNNYLLEKIYVLENKNKLVDDLNISNNIYIIKEKVKRYYINDKILNKQCKKIFSEFSLEINPKKRIYQLKNYEKKIIEIYKAYILGIKLIILKNLSTYLSDDEIHQLFIEIEKLKQRGVSFIVIDNYPEIVNIIANRVFLINKGRSIWTFNKGELNKENLTKFFLKQESKANKILNCKEKTLLEIKHLTAKHIKNLDLVIKEGEINLLFDTSGSANEELFQILIGGAQYSCGDIFMETKSYNVKSIYDALKREIAFINDSLIENLAINDFSLIENLCYPVSSKIKHFWLDKSFINNIKKNYSDYFEEKDLNVSLGKCSLRDLQIVNYLKWHIYKPKVLVCFKPLSSVDQEFEEITIELIRQIVNRKISVLILSSNYFEANIIMKHFNVNFKRMPPSI